MEGRRNCLEGGREGGREGVRVRAKRVTFVRKDKRFEGLLEVINGIPFRGTRSAPARRRRLRAAFADLSFLWSRPRSRTHPDLHSNVKKRLVDSTCAHFALLY